MTIDDIYNLLSQYLPFLENLPDILEYIKYICIIAVYVFIFYTTRKLAAVLSGNDI